MKKERIGLRTGVSMWVNLLLLLAMVATNLLSFYHLSSNHSQPTHLSTTVSAAVPDHLVTQLATIRATISHLTRLHPTTAAAATSPKFSLSSDLLLYSKISPIATACHDHPDLLHRYMNYTPFHLCPPLSPPDLAETLVLRGCHPLPRRRCFSPTSKPHASLPSEPSPPAKSNLDLTIPQLLRIAREASAWPIRLGLDVGGGTAAFAATMKAEANATVLTTTMNLGGARNSEAAASRGVIPLHMPLQQRFPIHDGVVDLVRCGHAVNRWIPTPALEFLLCDADRVLRSGGLLWMDHFFCKNKSLEELYAPMIRKLGYRVLKWTVGNKTDGGGVKNGEVYLTALLQKHGGK